MEKQAMPTKQQTVVLYPFPVVGHVVPMVQLAETFLRHGYSVTVAVVKPPCGLPTGFSADAIDRIVASNPSISFHFLPQIPNPPEVRISADKPPQFVMIELMQRYNAALEAFLLSIPRPRLHSLVTSIFTSHAVEVAAKLRVPVYTFFACAAATLAVAAQLPALLAGRQTGLEELGEEPLRLHGVPPFPASHLMVSLLRHPEDHLCRAMADVLRRCTDADGVLINTFESLETQTVQALKDPQRCPLRCPAYCVGPLAGAAAADHHGSAAAAQRHECLTWLDAQPERSVVFVCFGSGGLLSAEQLREIAVGLDKSGQRFIWTVRKPAAGDGDDFLPEGFSERTKDRGVVVESWAPQVDVLQHPSTGAFVTHCGWNSALEAIKYGVPMLCWPLYAEQKLNKVFITDAMGVGMEMDGYSAGFIRAEEVEAKVRLLLTDSKAGTELRARVVAHQKEAQAALEDGGSSQAAFLQFLTDVNNLLSDYSSAPDESDVAL